MTNVTEILKTSSSDVPSPAMTHAFFSLMMAGMNPPRDVFTPELVAEYYEDVYSS